jgi:hypothetical protein
MRKLGIIIALVLSLLLICSSAAVAAPPEKIDVIIGFDRPPGPSEQGLVHGFGGEIIYTYNIIPAIAASIPETAIQGLLRNPRVTIIEPDVTIHAIDAELQNSWGVEHIGAGDVHSTGNKGNGVKVAILDSGIDYTHPELQDNYAGGYDFVNDDDDPMDDNGHGTHVAGTIAALDNNDDSSVVGVAPDVKIYALKVLDADGNGSFISVIAALDWVCGEYGVGPVARITNNSYGSSDYPGDLVRDAFDYSYALWGVLHVAAAGNSGNPGGGGDRVEYPGRFVSVIAVAATDQNDNRASFSSTGQDVELAAPGVNVLSTYLNDGYAIGSGTSMASPHVAGTAALVMAAYPDWTTTQVRSELRNTADDLGTAGKDTLYGYGLVDADEAAIPSGPTNESPVVFIDSPEDGSTFESGATITFEGRANDTEDGDITTNLVWTSDIDGQIGNGGVPSVILSDGQHTITASVVDSGGKTGSDSISIKIGTPPQDVTVTGISPNTVLAGGSVDVTITGSGFDNGADVTFESGAGPAPAANNVTVVDSNTITATVQTKSGGPPRDRVWDVRVTNPDSSSGVLVSGFTVSP